MFLSEWRNSRISWGPLRCHRKGLNRVHTSLTCLGWLDRHLHLAGAAANDGHLSKAGALHGIRGGAAPDAL